MQGPTHAQPLHHPRQRTRTPHLHRRRGPVAAQQVAQRAVAVRPHVRRSRPEDGDQSVLSVVGLQVAGGRGAAVGQRQPATGCGTDAAPRGHALQPAHGAFAPPPLSKPCDRCPAPTCCRSSRQRRASPNAAAIPATLPSCRSVRAQLSVLQGGRGGEAAAEVWSGWGRHQSAVYHADVQTHRHSQAPPVAVPSATLSQSLCHSCTAPPTPSRTHTPPPFHAPTHQPTHLSNGSSTEQQ